MPMHVVDVKKYAPEMAGSSKMHWLFHLIAKLVLIFMIMLITGMI